MPIAPSAISSRIRTIAGKKRVHIASMANTPPCRAALTISTVAAGVTVNDFSTSTALPARIAASATARCCGCGVAMYSTSTPSSAMIAWYESWVRPIPCSAANAAARSADRDATATSSAPGTCGKSRTRFDAIRPGPMTPHRTMSIGPSWPDPTRPAAPGRST